MLTTKAGTMERYFFPFRMIVGASYQYNKKWIFAGDYTFQKCQLMKNSGTNQEFQDYHKAAIGGSLQPNESGRYWWQRNKYTAGLYFTRSQLKFSIQTLTLMANRPGPNAASLSPTRVDVGSCR